MTKIYRYIVTYDSGMAPCPQGGMVTLATCKPKIRKGAQRGDWVVGFLPGSGKTAKVVWAGRVQSILSVGDYQRKYPARNDAVYRAKFDGSFERLNVNYHDSFEEFRKDTSAPVLLFDPAATWYFGVNAVVFPDALQHLVCIGRGHRVNGVRDDDVSALEAWLNSTSRPLTDGKSNIPVEPSLKRCGTSCGQRYKSRLGKGPFHPVGCHAS